MDAMIDLKIMLGMSYRKAEEIAEMAETKYGIDIDTLVTSKKDLVFDLLNFILEKKEPKMRLMGKKNVNRLIGRKRKKKR